MLPEIAADVVHFLSRRDLDKACAVSKWLDALIAQCCELYPLRRVFEVKLLPPGKNDFMPTVFIDANEDPGTYHSFSSLDVAVHFTGSILRHSYVEHLELGEYYDGIMTLLPDHWKTLVDSIRSGAVQRIYLNGVDLSALDDDVFLVAVGCPGLQSLEVRGSVFNSDIVNDDMIQFSVANGLLELWVWGNNRVAPCILSNSGSLDFYFPADEATGRHSFSLKLDGLFFTDVFLKKFFERLLSSPIRHSGSLEFYGAAKQRGLSAYDQYMALNGLHDDRFPSNDGENSSYEVALSERPWNVRIEFGLVSRSS